MVDKLGMIAFGKVKQLEKRIKLLEETIALCKSKTSPEEVRDNSGTVR